MITPYLITILIETLSQEKYNNIHSSNDLVLNWLYWFFTKIENISYSPIGRDGIKLDIIDEKIKNKQLNEFGHFSYSEQLEKIVKIKPDFYK